MDLSQFKVRSFIIGIIALGLLIVVASFGINQIYRRFVQRTDENPVVTTFQSPSPTPGGSPASTPSALRPASPTPTAKPGQVAQATPQSKGGITQQPVSGSDTVEVEGAGIELFSPKAGDTFPSLIAVSGKANVVDGKVTIEVRDANDNVIATKTTQACFGTGACPFETTIEVTSPTGRGTLEAYNPSYNNTRKYSVSVPINFK